MLQEPYPFFTVSLVHVTQSCSGLVTSVVSRLHLSEVRPFEGCDHLLHDSI